jgi:hypothetical protein
MDEETSALYAGGCCRVYKNVGWNDEVVVMVVDIIYPDLSLLDHDEVGIHEI